MPIKHYLKREELNALRAIPLEDVLLITQCKRDEHDKKKWKTPQGTISVDKQKFYPWSSNRGGGGAIDLAMYLFQSNVSDSIYHLKQLLPTNSMTTVPQPSLKIQNQQSVQKIFYPPAEDEKRLMQAVQYLVYERALPLQSFAHLIHKRVIYADSRGNVVFLLLGKNKTIVGAELRGTGSISFKGMYSGSKKNLGFFYTGNPESKKAILCESGIDAVSCSLLIPNSVYISTSGANSKPHCLPILLQRGFEVYCGYDLDEKGETTAQIMIETNPDVKRLRPKNNDWNEDLKSRR